MCVRRNRRCRTVAVAALLALGSAGCGGGGAPASPTSPVQRPAPVLHVLEAVLSRLTGSSSAPPSAEYAACYDLRNPSFQRVTVSLKMELFGPDGTAYTTTTDAGTGIEATLGGSQSGCGAVIERDLDLTHRYATRYRLTVSYKYEDGSSGTVSGEAAVLPLFRAPASPVGLVISNFRARGPKGAGDKFIELHNASAAPIDASRWYINISDQFGMVTGSISLPAATLLPGCYYLFTASAADGYSGQVRGDAAPVSGMVLPDEGGLGVFNVSGEAIDMVGLSYGALYREGVPLTSLGTAAADRSYVRVGRDTNDNSRDFVVQSPSAPRNSSSRCVVDQ